MKEKKNYPIRIDIKFGKNIKKAEFDVFYSNSSIVLNSMYLVDHKDGKEVLTKQMEHTKVNYFRTNYDKIKEEFHRISGEVS